MLLPRAKKTPTRDGPPAAPPEPEQAEIQPPSLHITGVAFQYATGTHRVGDRRTSAAVSRWRGGAGRLSVTAPQFHIVNRASKLLRQLAVVVFGIAKDAPRPMPGIGSPRCPTQQ